MSDHAKNLRHLKNLSIALDNIIDFSNNPESFLQAWGMTTREFQECVKYAIQYESLDLEDTARLSVLGKLYNFNFIADEMRGIALDPVYTTKQRSIALATIWFNEGTQAIYDSLEVAEKIELCRPWLFPMIKTCKIESFPRVALNQLLTNTPMENLPELVFIIEEIRLFCNVDADRVYTSYINSLTDLNRFDTLLICTGLTPFEMGYNVQRANSNFIDMDKTYTPMSSVVQ